MQRSTHGDAILLLTVWGGFPGGRGLDPVVYSLEGDDLGWHFFGTSSLDALGASSWSGAAIPPATDLTINDDTTSGVNLATAMGSSNSVTEPIAALKPFCASAVVEDASTMDHPHITTIRSLKNGATPPATKTKATQFPRPPSAQSNQLNRRMSQASENDSAPIPPSHLGNGQVI